MLFTFITVVNYIILGFMVWRQGQQVTAHCSTIAHHILQRQRKLTKTTALVLISYLALTVPVSISSYAVSINSNISHFVWEIMDKGLAIHADMIISHCCQSLPN